MKMEMTEGQIMMRVLFFLFRTNWKNCNNLRLQDTSKLINYYLILRSSLKLKVVFILLIYSCNCDSYGCE